MRINRIILLFLFIIIAATVKSPTQSLSYPLASESITQYIIDLSREITSSIQEPLEEVYASKGELMLRLFLSPWGELKDAYISESSGNKELDSLYLKAVWMHERYQPFPEGLGDSDRWIDVPIIFDIDSSQADPIRKSSVSYGAGREVTELGLNEAIDIASENHMAAKIACEEIALSRLKMRESRRALYPAASVNYMETTGKTTSNAQDFKDKEYNLKFEYPLYYGWRLRYALDQAVSNMKASRENYDKVLQDLRIEVELAFYSYLATRINVGTQRFLLKEAEKIFDTAKKRFNLGLSTMAEFLQVESQVKQISYQVISSENDADMARVSLMQAMNAHDLKDFEDLIEMDGMREMGFIEFEFKDIDVTLEDCMDLAFASRPDLRSKEHIVEFNEYGHKIAQSKDQLKVDFTGNYGKSGGAYESESLTLEKDWYVGFKASKPLGGNTISTSYTKDETSEKHGQATRTESVSKAMQFGFLDNLQSFSEKKSAEIALKKAKDELEETKKGIFKEVKESYLNYKKGLIQVRSNFDKIKYREEELKIAKARSGLNEIPFSELLRAHMNLTDEKSFYIEARGGLYQSLVRLNKATGYALFLDDENFMLAKTRK